MVIDINSINPNQPGGSRSRTVEAQQARQKIDSSTTEKHEAPIEKRGENVSFSGKAKNFQQIEASLKELPQVDSDKVAKIRAALEDGTYNVSAENVAQKMLNMEKHIL
ncbi:flagellar biosynthesis anti-sigma factor FlgM [Alkalimarinus alittae]|uniref:Negative regulator of flagellin synthesis n=1 Tax=Alkalimarinus alittae TaxID=2961619 RepID=A0ABY6N6K1_9ALTE|nr:flagellar biosynthesis anti-sigma factor FlgM [Alkalimarinus alittae]UZE97760.1 flagellar biosynthesis anti-sigma factor FlgM [Alkalimarinus alittae]